MLTFSPNSESTIVDPTRITVRRITKELARGPIERHHYLKKWPSSKICFGVFKDEFQFFGVNITNVPIGVLVYGYPGRRGLAQEISPLLQKREVLELKRLWVEDGHGRNIESYVIGQSRKLLRTHHPEVKVLVSYADPSAGHRGTIYQATGWDYQIVNKVGKGSSFAISLVPNPKQTDWIHSRSAGRRFGKTDIELLKRKFGHDFSIRRDSDKYRYLYFNCDRREKKRLMKSLRRPIAEYRKEMNYAGGVEEIKVGPEHQIQRSLSV